jgi:hypothetical protein
MKLAICKFISSSFLLGSLSILSLNAHAVWQCYVADQGGHYWTSTGSTPDLAEAVATNFCTAHSPQGDTCHTAKCFEKQ